MSTAEINVARSDRPLRPSLVRHAARIALTSCLGHWVFWIWLLTAVVFGALVIRGPSPLALSIWPVLAYFSGLVSPSFLLEHFVSARARLVPRFRQVHLAAMAICGVGIFCLLAVWLALWCHTSILPIAGAAVLAFAIGCCTVARRWLIGVSYLAIFLLVARHDWAVVFVSAVESGAGNLLCLLAGSLLLAWFGHWLYRLDETNPAYERCRMMAAAARLVLRMPRRRSWAQPGLADGTGWSRPGLPSAVVFPLQDWLLSIGLRRGRSSIGWNVLRWELAWPLSLIAPLGILIALLLGTSVVAAVILSVTDWNVARPICISGLYTAGTIVPLVLICFSQVERQSMLPIESLRPVARRHFVHQWGAAVLWRMAGGIVLCAIFLLLAIASSQGQGDSQTYFAWGCLLAASLLIISALLALLPTIGLAVLRVVVIVLGSLVFFTVVAGIANLETRQVAPPAHIFSLAAVMVAASAGIFWLAYRRWLVTDLG